MTPHSPRSVANAFLNLGKRDNIPITHLKLQKLVYYAHGWNLAIFDRPLINESIEAWKFGPVVPSLYHEFKASGNRPISDFAHELKFVPPSNLESFRPIVEETDSDHPLLARVWETYKGLSGFQLSQMTHAQGTPWEQVASQHPEGLPKRIDIPDELIRKHFTDLAAERQEA